MKETIRIRKLFDDLYQGNPWIDVNIIGVLTDISASEASRKLYPNWNSIWEILNHLIEWRFVVLQRLQGKVIKSPDNNFFVPIIDKQETAWIKTLERLEDSQNTWTNFLKKCKEEDLEFLYPDNNMSYYEHIHGIIQHDLYHLGQIVLLRKFIKQVGPRA